MTISEDPPLLLLLDFDGTVCVGDGPVWAYAEAVLGDTADTTGEGDEVRQKLGAFLDGQAGDYIDGYAAVAQLAGTHASAETLQRAYRASRLALADGILDVHAPEGLADLLADLAPATERILVTNAPADGVAETLERIGVSRHIDRIVSDAGKPSGWSTLLPELLHGRDPARCMAVGDIWTNDLEPPHDAGCATALIDRFGRGTGAPGLAAPTFEQLYDGVRAWAAANTRLATSTD